MSDEANGQSEAPAGSQGAGQGDDLARRQAALRSLAQRAPQQPASAPAATATQPAQTKPVGKTARKAPASNGFASLITGERRAGRRRGVIVGVSLALLVVIVVGGIFGARAYLAQRAATQPNPVLRLDPSGDYQLGCISNIVWSPDGSQIAVLGAAQGDCGGASSNAPTDEIIIYNAASGRVITQLQPDRVVLDSAQFKQFAAANNEAGQMTSIYVQGLTWTRDQQTLVMFFGVSIQPPEGQNSVAPGMFGVLQMGIRSAALTKLRVNPTSTIIPNHAVPRWDLTTGDVSWVALPTASATLFRWTGDGQIVADGSAASKPIGSPYASQTFSIWQPGTLTEAEFAPPGQNTTPVAMPQDIEWNVGFAALSPDGRYYYPYFPAGGSLTPPSTQHPFPEEARIEPHDAALVTLARQLSATPSFTNQPLTLIAWRPDGRLLASVAVNGSGSITDANFTVTLYDTRTSQVVKRLTPDFKGLQSVNSGQPYLSWSPDGKRLLLLDNLYGSITIWGPGALPA